MPPHQLLCQYGADTEDVFRLMSGMPGLAVAIAATYHHLRCFAALLLYGARPGLADLARMGLPEYVVTQCSVPHAIIKYRRVKIDSWIIFLIYYKMKFLI